MTIYLSRHLIITNPNAVSEIEENKKNELFGSLQGAIQAEYQDEESFNAEIDKLSYYFNYE